ncbi:MAG: cysteine desulfurase NifS [Elusimicrobiota bacterium]
MQNKKIYFDHTAGTPLDPRVLEEMLPFLDEEFGNPSSLHSYGDIPQLAIAKARSRVAGLIGAKPEEIIFTSCGSEANNLAIKGVARAFGAKGNHIIISAIEHFSVLNCAKTLEKTGCKVTYVPVDSGGMVKPNDVKKEITDKTVLISIMHANNEIGTIEPVEEISKITREKGIIFHTDAVQTAGTIPVKVEKLGVDLLTMAGTQFYGPKGAAALYVRKGVRIIPLIDGGLQEGGRRAGTENVAGIVGMGKAAELAEKEMEKIQEKILPLRDKLIKKIPELITHARLNGHPEKRLFNNVNFSIEYVEGESMLMLLNSAGIASSSGSACTSRALKASHVLLAIGLKHEVAHGSLLFTLGKDNTEEEVDYLLQTLPPIVKRLREMSPLYPALR